MTKAFLVYIKQESKSTSYGIWTSGSSFPLSQQCPSQFQAPDNRPILVITKDIADAASKYPKASQIQEIDVRDVVISEKVDYLLEKR